MSDEQEISEIRGDIEDTRQEMSRTIEQLEEKLSVTSLQAQFAESLQHLTDQVFREFQDKTGALTGNLNSQIESALHSAASSKIDQLFEHVGSKTTSVGGSIWQRLGENPVPISIAALGIGLLAAEGEQIRSVATGHDGPGVAASIKETVSGQISTLREGASSLTEQVHLPGRSEKPEESSKSHESIASLRHAVSNQALVPGLLAMGIGIVAGLAIPETGTERTSASSARERIMHGLDQAELIDSSGKGDSLINTVKSNASDLITDAVDASKAAVSEVRNSASEMKSEIANSVKRSSGSSQVH